MVDRTPDDLDNANTRYFDSAIRHQIGVRRFSGGEVKRILAIVEKSDAEVATLLRKRLKKLAGKPLDLTTERYKAMLTELKTLRKALRKEIFAELRGSLTKFGKQEAKFEERMLSAALDIDVDFVAVSAPVLKSLVTTRPFAGGANAARTLKQWFDGMAIADQRRLTESIQLGLLQGETTDQMVRRVVGTRAKKYSDGVLAINRRGAEAVVRTAVNHVSNASREEFWKENDGLFDYLKWTSTLDGRTSAICRGRDGALVLQGDAPLPSGERMLEPQSARPPAHPGCRSIMVALLSSAGVALHVGDRPYVKDTRTGRKRIKDFRAEAKAAAGKAGWSAMTVKQRNGAILDIKKTWTKTHVGRIPSDVTYNQWLKRQSNAFQDDVLGKTKGKLFRSGKISLDKFTDKTGNEYTLEQLASTRPEVFESAGIDLSNFK